MFKYIHEDMSQHDAESDILAQQDIRTGGGEICIILSCSVSTA